MTEKRKYPKSFYDDGLGDILEWIDDEVLVHSEKKRDLGENEGTKKVKGRKESKKSEKKKVKLYGDNKIDEGKKYKPPKGIKFELEEEEDVKVDKKLEDRTRGLVNRLAAQTMPFVTSEFEKLYSSNQRSAVSGALYNNIEASILNKHALSKRKIVAESMLLVSYLTSKISQDIGGFFVHRLVYQFENLYRNDESDNDKRLDNIILCLVNLYIIGLLNANIIFEVTKRICSSSDFRPKSVEILSLLIRSIGFQLRKDSPTMMRQHIIMTQDQVKHLKSNSEVETRIGFMMDALIAIKNNNMSKLVNYGSDVDRDLIESTLKGLMKRTKLPEPLCDASYDDILSSQSWYLLETRVDENQPFKEANKQEKNLTSKTDLKLCKALRLNKPAEMTIFSGLLRASDYVEASNLIIGFGMNYCSDAMLVCVHVAIYEKKYNPFYFNLINNLCKFNRKYKMATKFTIQDKIRILSGMSDKRVEIFKTLTLELIKYDAIPITILKAVEWADMSKATREYLVFLLESISELPDEEKRKILSKVDKKSSFLGAMRTFINCFAENCQLFH